MESRSRNFEGTIDTGRTKKLFCRLRANSRRHLDIRKFWLELAFFGFGFVNVDCMEA